MKTKFNTENKEKQGWTASSTAEYEQVIPKTVTNPETVSLNQTTPSVISQPIRRKNWVASLATSTALAAPPVLGGIYAAVHHTANPSAQVALGPIHVSGDVVTNVAAGLMGSALMLMAHLMATANNKNKRQVAAAVSALAISTTFIIMNTANQLRDVANHKAYLINMLHGDKKIDFRSEEASLNGINHTIQTLTLVQAYKIALEQNLPTKNVIGQKLSQQSEFFKFLIAEKNIHAVIHDLDILTDRFTTLVDERISGFSQASQQSGIGKTQNKIKFLEFTNDASDIMAHGEYDGSPASKYAQKVLANSENDAVPFLDENKLIIEPLQKTIKPFQP